MREIWRAGAVAVAGVLSGCSTVLPGGFGEEPSSSGGAMGVVETPELLVNPADDPIPCPYTTFATQSAMFPDRPLLESTVGRRTYENLERRYARALRRVGWREVRADRDPAFYLGLALHQTSLVVDRRIVIGTVVLRATSNTHRDATFATMEGAVRERYYLGADAPVELWIQDEDAAKPVRDVVDAHGDTFGTQTWKASRDAVLGLCTWREALERDGIPVEALRRELVEEMMVVRERAKQRKELDVEVER